MGVLSLFKRQPEASDSTPSSLRETLPTPGGVAPCLFSHNRETVYAMCKVEERDGTSLMLRIVREVGKITLSGLKVGVAGHIEVGDFRIPFHVVQVQLPWVAVATSPERRHPIQREFFRIPASFTVRFCQRNPQGMWATGKGINLSSGGFRFALQGKRPLQIGTELLTELTINFTPSQHEKLEMPAEVRWVSRELGEIVVGVRVTGAACRKDLANTVSQLQRLMAHQPEDYILIDTQRPRLRS